MLSAGVVALTSVIYGKQVQNWGLRRTVVFTLILFAGCSVALPLLMRQFPNSLTVYAFAYLLAQVRGSLGTIQYATVLNEQFGHRGPERVVGVVGVGATLAGISMGMLIFFFPSSFDVEWLLYVAAALDVATIIPLLWLRSQRKKENLARTNSHENMSPVSSLYVPDVNQVIRFRDLYRSKYVLYIAGTVTLCILATTFVEYQWKVTVAEALNRDAGKLARYFGFFYGVVYFITGLLQLFATSQLLQGRGVLLGLITFPAALLVSTLVAWSAATERILMWTLTLSKGTDTLRRGFHDPTLQILYGPLEKGLRRQAITFVAGIAKPFAEAIAGITMVILMKWIAPQQLSNIVIAIIVLWLLLSKPLWNWFKALRH